MEPASTPVQVEGLVYAPDELRANEKIPTKVFKKSFDATRYIASEIAKLICERAAADKSVVLGLACGSTPIGVYNELIRMHKEEGLSFKNVIAFNLDEYYPISPTATQSFSHYMHKNFFDHVDIKPENIHLPKGDVPEFEVGKECERYEKLLNHYGVDIQILGTGAGGDIGFNDAGSSIKSTTRVIHLNRQLRKEAAAGFFGLQNVPTRALTMGLSSILSAKRIFWAAFSEGKAGVVRDTVEGRIDPLIPCSYLQTHSNTEIILDVAAANNLTRTVAPWTLITPTSQVSLPWDDDFMLRKAVIWLSLKLGKSILKLREEDYIENDLERLLDARGRSGVQQLNRSVFKYLSSTITGWPGGHPPTSFDSLSPNQRKNELGMSSPTGSTMRVPQDYVINNYTNIKRHPNPQIDNEIYPKRIIVFSPHPDDDVISMGGTLIRLVEQGHQVHVAYQTSGNYAVWDDDVTRFANFTTRFSEIFGLPSEHLTKLEEEVEDFFSSKLAGQVDSQKVLKIKGLIRETEARNAARFCGVHKENIHFLNLPFYESGTEKKKPMGEDDINIIQELLEKVKPHQIYAAGDLSDPHGTHRVCLQAIIGALHKVKKQAWFDSCQVWLYRGAWQEWEPHEIKMAVPMSPEELMQKRYAIFKHQSQKDPPLFPGSDKREFWQRSEARNRATAAIYDKLGLTDYEGMEAFVEYIIDDPNNIL